MAEIKVEIEDNSQKILDEFKKRMPEVLDGVGNELYKSIYNFMTEDKVVDTGRLRGSISYSTPTKDYSNPTMVNTGNDFITGNKEENTVAYDFDNKISDDVKLQRFEEIMEIQYQVIEDNNKLLLGKTFEALVDHFDNRKQMFALRSYREAPDEVDGYIYVKDSLEIGKYYNIEIRAYGYEKLVDYYDFGGIRLEDDVLVTEDGARRLGPYRLPIKSSDIEDIMAKE